MKTTTLFLGAIALLALAGCQTALTPLGSKLDFSGLPATAFTISVSGTAGLRFTGTLVADGQTREVAGAVPAQYQVTAHELICSFKKTQADGSIVLVVSEENGVRGSSNTPERFGGVRAHLLRTPSRQHTLFTTF